MDEPKPKRKYVMTPEHKAKVVASLEKARLVPKEIRYRRTEKRYQANLNNLGIAAAKRREKAAQELQDVRAQMESTFPPGEPGFGIRAPGSSPNPESRTPPLLRVPRPRVPSPGSAELEQATRLVDRRLRMVRGRRRREGRRIMQVLTEALDRSQPLNLLEAICLTHALVQCLWCNHMTDAVQRMNRKIARLLVKMIEARYGPEVELEDPWYAEGRRLQEKLRRLAGKEGSGPKAEGPEEEGSRQKAEGSQAREGDKRSSATVSANPESRIPNPGSSASPESPVPSPASSANPESQIPNPAPSANPESRTPNPAPPRPHVLPLPATEEEFRQLLVRALDLEGQPGLAQTLSEAIWERLGVWQGRHEEETGNLDRFFQTPLRGDADRRDRELRERGETLPAILDLPLDFQERLTDLTCKVNQELDQWLEIVKAREEAGARPGSAPRKPPVGVDLSEAGSSKGESEVA